MHQEIKESPNSENARYSSVYNVLYPCMSKAWILHLIAPLLPMDLRVQNLVSNNS
jgi:hypothetical protein